MNVCQYCYSAQSFRASRGRGHIPLPHPPPSCAPPFLNSYIRPCLCTLYYTVSDNAYVRLGLGTRLIVHARVPKKHTIAFQGYAHKAEGCKVRNKVQINGTVSTKIAPRLECYKIASRLNRYNFPTDNAIDFLFSTLQ